MRVSVALSFSLLLFLFYFLTMLIFCYGETKIKKISFLLNLELLEILNKLFHLLDILFSFINLFIDINLIIELNRLILKTNSN
jgi:hypothetical protein